jgi:hypothetical protein
MRTVARGDEKHTAIGNTVDGPGIEALKRTSSNTSLRRRAGEQSLHFNIAGAPPSLWMSHPTKYDHFQIIWPDTDVLKPTADESAKRLP